MVYKKLKNEKGDYKDNTEVRFSVLEAHEAWTPQGKNVGWDEYPDLQTAVTAYGLTYDPLSEKYHI